MSRVILLDSGVLGTVTHPRRNAGAKAWLRSQLHAGMVIVVTEIADYEVRRELLRVGSVRGIDRLDILGETVGYLPITTRSLRRAAEFWATARRLGQPTAGDDSLDADVILAAQAATLAEDGHDPVIATTNVRHLARFVDAREWQEIT